MKIALVLLPMWTTEVPPLGIASLSAVLKKEGHDVKCFDLNLSIHRTLDPRYWEASNARCWANPPEFRAKILPRFSERLAQFAHSLVREDFEAVGLTIYGSNFLSVSWFATLLKVLKPEMKIVIGGPEVGHHEFHRLARFQLQGVIDAAVLGEGETSAISLFRAWEGGKPILGLPGVIAEDGGKLKFSGRPPALDMNGMVPPDFSDFELKSYSRDYLPVVFSRGCVANCVFCNEKSFLWPSFRMAGSDEIFDQLNYLSEKYQTNNFWATDSLLNGNHAKLEGFVDLVLARKIKFHWGGNMRIDKRLKPPLCVKLKEAGFNTVWFGVESGSNTVLKAMRKGITREDTLQVLPWIQEAGIQVGVNLIVGFPGESEKDFEDTLRLLDGVGETISWVNTSIFVVDPMTDVGKNPAKYGILADEAGQVVVSESTTYLGNSWISESGDSTPEIRWSRLQRLRRHVGTRHPSIHASPLRRLAMS